MQVLERPKQLVLWIAVYKGVEVYSPVYTLCQLAVTLSERCSAQVPSLERIRHCSRASCTDGHVVTLIVG
jgi:hypothetical protein